MNWCLELRQGNRLEIEKFIIVHNKSKIPNTLVSFSRNMPSFKFLIVYLYGMQYIFSRNKWIKIFKNEPSKICGRQPLKYLTWSILEYFVPNEIKKHQSIYIFQCHSYSKISHYWKPQLKNQIRQQTYFPLITSR